MGDVLERAIAALDDETLRMLVSRDFATGIAFRSAHPEIDAFVTGSDVDREARVEYERRFGRPPTSIFDT